MIGMPIGIRPSGRFTAAGTDGAARSGPFTAVRRPIGFPRSEIPTTAICRPSVGNGPSPTAGNCDPDRDHLFPANSANGNKRQHRPNPGSKAESRNYPYRFRSNSQRIGMGMHSFPYNRGAEKLSLSAPLFISSLLNRLTACSPPRSAPGRRWRRRPCPIFPGRPA